jgi:hypothetical protein
MKITSGRNKLSAVAEFFIAEINRIIFVAFLFRQQETILPFHINSDDRPKS